MNGFDGAITTLGLITGFRISDSSDTNVILGACVGAAVALGVSGVTSAYISESAERKRELADLEQAMVTDLTESAHARASRLVPLVIAAVNGLAPLVLALAIIVPLWLAESGFDLYWPALDLTFGLAFVVIFLLGVLLGRVSGRFWLWAGVRAVIVAGFTAGLISLIQ